MGALPLAALRLTPKALATAGRFGLERVGDLLPLPRGPLARRLGMTSVRRLDEALGRVAVDHRHREHTIGSSLLREAMQRTLDTSRLTGARMLMVHAIDDDAVAFCLRYGFHIFPAASRTMFLPIETIAAAL